MNPNIEQVLAVFAQTEEEQGVYFPEYASSVLVSIGTFEVTTQSARLVALCALAELTQRAQTCNTEFAERAKEVSSIAHLIIQISGIYDWLGWHPNRFTNDPEGVADPTIYGIWSVVRRLCQEAIRSQGVSPRLRPYMDLFSEIVHPIG